ncbi:F-ATPase subunit 6 [Gemella morbillorum]|jgi:ATP synthase F0, A subunit|uniref:ATP synthase subunit a n=1 Tax=Gemella morbillorum TaxID=29391 RepID=A0A2X4N902_9BACL|nr:F0F1 ATP synthase subunit A [Gemella morbillorum]EFV35561.1 ATP synthase subunit A [Gemella morbillorum M424]MBF1209210.1 F0F1 ATP synthase subunit A [Gemella morbillorum]QGS08821.1 F0F1 ATP synthase subunit A [Gemella morbillorum]UBH81118.1 F0F1 ATP synthase subunit A [Gemella morbillorum]SQH54879.1 F-ATPase subunit 6 [Gemella morbillorum]
MENHTYLISKLFGYDITVNIPSAITTLITVVLTFIFVMFITSRIKLRPDSKRQNMAELLAFFVSDNIIKGNVDWKKYGKGLWATALTLISFIAIANTIGVLIEVSYDGVVYVNSITADPTFTFTLAVLVIVFTHYAGLKYKGPKHYVGTYTSSGIGIAPFKIIEEFTNLLTLSMRLFGNIYAGEVLLALLATLATAGVFGAITGITGLVVWKGFSLFIGFIQAYIFTILSFIYLSHKINDEH